MCQHGSTHRLLRRRCRNSMARNRGPRALPYGERATGIGTSRKLGRDLGPDVDGNSMTVPTELSEPAECGWHHVPTVWGESKRASPSLILAAITSSRSCDQTVAYAIDTFGQLAQATAEEYKATAQGTITDFGTYSVNEANRTIDISVDASLSRIGTEPIRNASSRSRHGRPAQADRSSSTWRER